MFIRKSQLVFYSCLAFVVGVAAASFIFISWLIIYVLILICVNLLIFSQPKSLLKMIILCSLFFALGIARYQLSLPVIDKNHLAFYNGPPAAPDLPEGNSDGRASLACPKCLHGRRARALRAGQKITFQGLVVDEPDIRKDHVKLKIQGLALKGNVLVKTALIPQYNYGDILEINCLLNQPEPIEDFKYDKYLAKSDIYSVCYNGQIKLLSQGRGDLLKTAIFKVKNKMVQIVSRILPEPQSSFLGGLLWGAKKGLPSEILDDFNRTGVTHIIAVSGYNIAIIAAALSSLFIGLGLSRKRAFWLIVLAIAFFIIITGWPSSIVRAGLMGIIVLISRSLGRATKMRNTLAVTCLIMLLINPLILIWDAGFQLSFLATIGLIYLSSHLAKRLNFLPNFLGLKDSLSTTLSAIIFTSPLILWQFGRFSTIAPLANLLVLPFIPLVMLLGFISVIFGLIYLPMAQIMAWPTWLVLTYILKVIEILANWHFAAVSL